MLLFGRDKCTFSNIGPRPGTNVRNYWPTTGFPTALNKDSECSINQSWRLCDWGPDTWQIVFKIQGVLIHLNLKKCMYNTVTFTVYKTSKTTQKAMQLCYTTGPLSKVSYVAVSQSKLQTTDDWALLSWIPAYWAVSAPWVRSAISNWTAFIDFSFWSLFLSGSVL